MAHEAEQIYFQRLLEQGEIDFSEHASVSNAAAPGVLIRTTAAGTIVNVTDIIIYNADAAAAVITLYDEDSTIKLIVSVGTLETAVIELKASINYGQHHIYGRTNQATNAEVTVAGRAVPNIWR